MKKVSYLVEFTYYHYNTGRSDNGNVKGRVAANSIQDARRIRDRINAWIPKADDMNINSSDYSDSDWTEYDKLCDDYLAGDGHFITGEEAVVIERTETIVDYLVTT